MKLLRIEPLEPLVLSRNPIVGPEFLTGFHRVLGAPLPTTIAGLLGNMLGVTITGVSRVLEALERLVSQLESRGCKSPIVKGPLFQFKELETREPYVYLGELYTPIGRVKVEKEAPHVGRLPYVDATDCRECVKLLVDERVGIKLLRGYGSDDKVVHLGHMFSYSTPLYETLDGKRVTPVILYSVSCNVKVEGVYRVGGEGRLAKVTIEDMPRELEEAFEKLVSPLEAERIEDNRVYIALTPIPVATTNNQLQVDTNTPGLEFVKSIVGVTPVKTKPTTAAELVRAVKRKVERLNLGYSEAVGARRPQILSLPVGTIVKARKPAKPPAKTIETLWRIGYATLLPALL